MVLPEGLRPPQLVMRVVPNGENILTVMTQIDLAEPHVLVLLAQLLPQMAEAAAVLHWYSGVEALSGEGPLDPMLMEDLMAVSKHWRVTWDHTHIGSQAALEEEEHLLVLALTVRTELPVCLSGRSVILGVFDSTFVAVEQRVENCCTAVAIRYSSWQHWSSQFPRKSREPAVVVYHCVWRPRAYSARSFVAQV